MSIDDYLEIPETDEQVTLDCPDCGARLEEGPSYRWYCPNDCYPGGMELGEWKQLIDELEV